MNYTEHKITLDIHRPVSQVSLRVKKGDTRRRLQIHLAEKGCPYHISEDCYAVFSAIKPDGTQVFDNCTIENSTVTYNMTLHVTAVPGLVRCEIKLYGDDDGLLTSASFQIIVENSVCDGEEIESSNEYDALTAIIVEARTLIDDLKNSTRVVTSGVTLLADNWQGEDSPYSQVVEIEGTTEYSKIDLQPSVEQLAIFHDKDLAFVTENEDGVVTVYAIGDKPTNDYTIQVTIMEVTE